eukprot:scaffold14310_cov16-Tisochrysis_lutea.AAC.1
MDLVNPIHKQGRAACGYQGSHCGHGFAKLAILCKSSRPNRCGGGGEGLMSRAFCVHFVLQAVRLQNFKVVWCGGQTGALVGGSRCVMGGFEVLLMVRRTAAFRGVISSPHVGMSHAKVVRAWRKALVREVTGHGQQQHTYGTNN